MAWECTAQELLRCWIHLREGTGKVGDSGLEYCFVLVAYCGEVEERRTESNTKNFRAKPKKNWETFFHVHHASDVYTIECAITTNLLCTLHSVSNEQSSYHQDSGNKHSIYPSIHLSIYPSSLETYNKQEENQYLHTTTKGGGAKLDCYHSHSYS